MASAVPQEKTVRVFTCRVPKFPGIAKEKCLGEGFEVRVPFARKQVLLGCYDESCSKELKKAEKALSGMGVAFRRMPVRWPRDVFFRHNGSLVLAFSFNYMDCLKAGFAGLEQRTPGEGGMMVSGKGFILASDDLSYSFKEYKGQDTDCAFKHLRDCFPGTRIHRVPSINYSAHIDCYLGVAPYRNVLLASRDFEAQRGKWLRELALKESLEVVIVPAREEKRNPTNFLVIGSGKEETILMNWAPATAELLDKKGVNVKILDKPLGKSVNEPGVSGLRCATNDAEPGLLEAILKKAGELVARPMRDRRFLALAHMLKAN